MLAANYITTPFARPGRPQPTCTPLGLRDSKATAEPRYFGSAFVSEEETVGVALEDVLDGCVDRFGVDVAGVAGAEPTGLAEQQPGTTGFGAPTPAMSEPSPSFCRVGASSFPFESSPLAD